MHIANANEAIRSIANAYFFTRKRVAAHNGPADVHAVFARAVVTSFGVFLVNGNARDFLLFVHDRLTGRNISKNPARHEGECDEE